MAPEETGGEVIIFYTLEPEQVVGFHTCQFCNKAGVYILVQKLYSTSSAQKNCISPTPFATGNFSVSGDMSITIPHAPLLPFIFPHFVQ
jgi:hypothetical protein